MNWTFCHTQILSNIQEMRFCCWKIQFESMAQDFGDQAFRDCWLFPRIFPPPPASFPLPIIWLAISDVTRITQACQCLYPLWRSLLLRCTFVIFHHWALTSLPDKVFISHPAPSLLAHFHISALQQQSGIKFVSSNQNNKWVAFLRACDTRQLIHSFASRREFPGSFPGIPSKLLSVRNCCSPSFEIRPETRNPNFSRDVWLVTRSTWPGKIGTISTRRWADQTC